MGRIKDEAFFQMVHDYLKIYLPNEKLEQLFMDVVKSNHREG